MIQLEKIFAKYVDLVGNYEGVTFLYESDWTPDEWKIISAILEKFYKDR